MPILKLIRQNRIPFLELPNTVCNKKITGCLINSLLENVQHERVIFSAFVANLNPDGDTTVFCAGGGSSFPYSKTGINAHFNLFCNNPRINKIIFLSHQSAYPREFEVSSSQMIMDIILQSKNDLLKPASHITCLGFSDGAEFAINFPLLVQNCPVFLKTIGRIEKIILLDEVGLAPNPRLNIQFALIPYATFLYYRQKGKSILNSFSEMSREISDSWASYGNNQSNLLKILKTLIFKHKHNYRVWNMSINHKKLKKIFPPYNDLKKGLYQQYSILLNNPTEVIVMVANQGLDPILNIIKNEFSAKQITNELWLKNQLHKRYCQYIFPNLDPKSIKISILEGSHSLFGNRKRILEVASQIN